MPNGDASATPAVAKRTMMVIAGWSALITGIASAWQALGTVEPCPLCLVQRGGFVLILVIALITLAVRPIRPGLGLAGIALTAVAGIAVGVRHLWLQGFLGDGPTIGSCGPGVEYLFATQPLGSALMEVLGGTGDCAAVTALLGVPLPAWSIAGFLAVLVLSALPYRKSLAETLTRRVGDPAQ